MTAEEFKKLRPEFKDVEGDILWNAMEDYMLEESRKPSKKPFWKSYKLRYLFYRKTKNFYMGSPSLDKWAANDRCKACKVGVNHRMVMMYFDESGGKTNSSPCPNCNKEYVAEPNINFTHKVYLFIKGSKDLFWLILDKIHLIKSSSDGRYGMFGDESSYVKTWSIYEEGREKVVLKKRRWFEYIFIKTK